MTSLPFVDSVTPDHGSAGTAVTIAGQRFTGTTAVTFDGNPAASFTVVDDNTITAVTPAGTGVVVVEITNADGSSSDLTLVDYSGNAFDGTYSLTGYEKMYVPGLVSGNPALLGGNTDASQRIAAELGPYTNPLEAPVGADSPFTVAWWQSCSSAWSAADVFPWGWEGQFGATAVVLNMLLGASGVVRFGNLAIPAETWVSDAFTGSVDGAPHFFALTFDDVGAVATLYMDGTPISWSQTGTTLNATFTESIFLGVFPEVIDEMAMFRSELSSGDISSLYSAGLSGFSSWDSTAAGLSPTAFYHFDDANNGLFTYSGQGWYVGAIAMAS